MSRIFEFADFTLSDEARTLARNGSALEVPAKVFEIVLLLARARGTVVSKDQLVEYVWAGAPIGDSNISQHLLLARRALGDRQKPYRLIQTVHACGYRLIPDVHIRTQPERHNGRQTFRRTIALHYVRAARHFAHMGTKTSLESSSDLCHFALAHASDCAEAAAQLAHNALVSAACGYGPPDGALHACKGYAAQALEIDPHCVQAQVALGFAQLFTGGTVVMPELRSAESEVLRMLCALSARRTDAALDAANAATARHPSSVFVATYSAFAAYHAGQFKRAATHLHELLVANPEAAFARVLLGRTLLALGDYAWARVHFETVLNPRTAMEARLEKFRADAIAGLISIAEHDGDRHGAAALQDDLLRCPRRYNMNWIR